MQTRCLSGSRIGPPRASHKRKSNSYLTFKLIMWSNRSRVGDYITNKLQQILNQSKKKPARANNYASTDHMASLTHNIPKPNPATNNALISSLSIMRSKGNGRRQTITRN